MMMKYHFKGETMNELYSMQDAADAIGMSWVWLDRQIRDGKIKAVWMGGKRKILASEVERVKVEGVK
jgi:predicted site-specific integrase-resolvase